MEPLSTPLAIVVGALFLVTGGVKILRVRQSLAIRDHFNMLPALWRTIGLLECAGAVGVMLGIGVHVLGLLAAGLAALMIGAVASRARVHDPARLISFDVAVRPWSWRPASASPPEVHQPAGGTGSLRSTPSPGSVRTSLTCAR